MLAATESKWRSYLKELQAEYTDEAAIVVVYGQIHTWSVQIKTKWL